MALAIVDSSVILDIFTADSQFYQQSLECLVQVGSYRTLGINGIVYSEISLGFNRIEDLDEALFGTGLKFLDIPREALFLAARAFAAYRRRGGSKTSVLPDFFIGAHAAVLGVPMVTRDPVRVCHAYPGLEILQP